MKNASIITLMAGLLATTIGLVLVAFSDQADGLTGIAVAITVLGVALVGMWLWSRVRGLVRPESESPPASLPGPWYPLAILGIFAALLCSLFYWTKIR